MPINNKIKARKFPMEIKFGKEPHTEFVNNLENIKVELLGAQDYENLKEFCIPFAISTWADKPQDTYKELKGKKITDLIMYKIFTRQLYPGTLDTIRLNFRIAGVSIQDMTHLTRYSQAKFSVECSGEKWWSDKVCVVPTAIENNKEMYERYKKICEDTKKLYCDMIDTKEISLRDARFILPRCTETYCYMSMSLGVALQFINDRIDTQIQPMSDNVIAYRIAQQLVHKYPILSLILNKNYILKPAKIYQMTCRNYLGSNLYPPDESNDIFEYNENDFVYRKTRNELVGGDNERIHPYYIIRKEVIEDLEKTKETFLEGYEKNYFEQDIPPEFRLY